MFPYCKLNLDKYLIMLNNAPNGLFLKFDGQKAIFRAWKLIWSVGFKEEVGFTKSALRAIKDPLDSAQNQAQLRHDTSDHRDQLDSMQGFNLKFK